ncbi:MAG: DUF1294 domain-containing protein [Pseudomonadota bacterium]
MPRKSVKSARPGRRQEEPRNLRVGTWRWLVVAAFAGILVILALSNALPLILLPVYVVASLAAFLLYALDKVAAMNGRWRTTESTLWLVGSCRWLARRAARPGLVPSQVPQARIPRAVLDFRCSQLRVPRLGLRKNGRGSDTRPG